MKDFRENYPIILDSFGTILGILVAIKLVF